MRSESDSYSAVSDSLQYHGLYSLPGFSVHGILQTRILEWVATSSSRDLPSPGIEPGSPALQEDSLQSEPPGKHPTKVKNTAKQGACVFFTVLLV